MVRGLVAASFAIVAATPGLAADVEPGVRYEGEQRLEFSAVGASFVLPAGWAGVLPQNAEYFVMECQTYAGYVFAGSDATTVEEARSVMGAPVDVGDGIVFHPAGAVEVDGSILTASYSVTGAQVELAGRIRTVVGEHGWGVAFIGASAPDQVEDLTGVMAAMGASLELGPPPSGGAAGASSSSSAASGSDSPWFEELNGRKLSHFFTRSGYTEEDYIWLCPEGRFYKSFNSGGFGGGTPGASGAFQSSNGGRWSVSGPLEGGTLTLTFNDGSVSQYTLTHEGTKLFLDGKRYFRETGQCG